MVSQEEQGFVAGLKDEVLCPSPVDHSQARETIRRLYKAVGANPPPNVIFTGSPLQALMLASMLRDNGDICTANAYNDWIDDAFSRMGYRNINPVLHVVGMLQEMIQIIPLRRQLTTDLGFDKYKSLVKWRTNTTSIFANIYTNWQGGSPQCMPCLRPLEAPLDMKYLLHEPSGKFPSMGRFLPSRLFTCFVSCLNLKGFITNQASTQPVGNSMNPLEYHNTVNLFGMLALSMQMFIPMTRFCIVCENPTGLHIDKRERLHNETGLAIEYPDGWGVYALNGVIVPKKVVMNPSDITLKEAHEYPNIEVRRLMQKAMGYDKYLDGMGFKPVQEDGFGVLYKAQQERDEDLCVVKVVNSTPEPDGTYKDYYLRVDPRCKTALEAVAWTWELSPEDYVLEKES